MFPPPWKIAAAETSSATAPGSTAVRQKGVGSMAECAYCGDEIEGKPIIRNDKTYCTKECADLDEEEFEEEELVDDDDDIVDDDADED